MPYYSFHRLRAHREIVARLMAMSEDELTAWCDARREDDWPLRRLAPDDHVHDDDCRPSAGPSPRRTTERPRQGP